MHTRPADENFTRFWAKYPRHVARQEAVKAWAQLHPDEALIVEMLEALEWQCLRWVELDFVPYPASWLRGRRWEDERPSGLQVSRLTPFELARRAGLK